LKLEINQIFVFERREKKVFDEKLCGDKKFLLCVV
jgi:hypothetical protein